MDESAQIIRAIAIGALPLIFAITLHEVAHGFVAYLCGDYTAKLSGRLSLNPIKHIDLIGTVILPLAMLVLMGVAFGWAKPVPVDPRNFKHPRWNMLLVALAGPAANLLMAIGWAMVAKLGLYLVDHNNVWFGLPLNYMGIVGISINVLLALLNLIPIPPLDGSRLLASILPGRWLYYFDKLEPFGFFILVFLLVFGVLNIVLFPPLRFLVQWIASVFGL